MKTKEEALTFLKSLNLNKNYKHFSNIENKLKKKDITKKKILFLIDCINKYKIYHEALNTTEDISKITENWNKYNNFIKNNNKNIFTSQSKFESSIIEESIYRIFKKFEDDIIKVGSTKTYLNMYYSANNFDDFKNYGVFKYNIKDMDFAIYKEVKLRIGNDHKEKTINIPIIAIECKTYIDKTMLESSVATAEKIKNGNPYCKFYIVTGTYEVDKNIDIIISPHIDQIYVLRKDNINNDIDKDVIKKLYEDVDNYLHSTWNNIDNNIKNHGILL